MKINPVLTFITFAISALAGYGFFIWNDAENYQLLLAIGASITIFLYLGGLVAVSSDRYGTTGNIRALSVVFLVLSIISNIIFSFVTLAKPTAYIIINGILLLIFMLIAYAVSRALK
jgi:hypothetical protein